MKNAPLLITFVVFMCCLKITHAQPNFYSKEEITIKKNFLFGPSYHQDYNILSKKELREKLKSNPNAYSLYKKSMAPKVISNIFGLVGGYLIGFGIATNVRDPYKLGLGTDHVVIGSAILLPGILLDVNATRKRQKAIQVYNKGLNSASTGDAFKLSLTGNGICLSF